MEKEIEYFIIESPKNGYPQVYKAPLSQILNYADVNGFKLKERNVKYALKYLLHENDDAYILTYIEALTFWASDGIIGNRNMEQHNRFETLKEIRILLDEAESK